MIIGQDVGYGWVKEVTAGTVRASFPSVTGNTEALSFANSIVGTGGGKAIQFDGNLYWYGNMALLQSRVQNTLMDRSRVSDTQARLLFIAGLVELSLATALDTPLRIVTGLPVDFYGDRAMLEQAMAGVHHVGVDGVAKHFNVEGVKVIPQPFGSLFSMMLDDKGNIADEDLAKSAVGVISAGTYTFDLAVMRPDAQGRPTYIVDESGSEPVGLSKVLELTRRDILAEYPSLNLSLHDVDKALMAGSFNIRGEPQSIVPFADPHLLTVGQRLLTKCKELWSEGLGLDVILVSGGGGAMFYPQIKAFYPHARLLEFPFWSNAMGFYRYGLREKTWER